MDPEPDLSAPAVPSGHDALGPSPFLGLATGDDPLRNGRWSAAAASDWAAARPWLVGCNYAPAYAVNQLEMWQPETFDADAIDDELRLAAGLGWNTVRVFLHDLLWADPDGLVERVERFLEIAHAHGIATMLVLLEGVWRNYAHPGPQPDPVPGVHNSGWVQSPNAKAVVDPSQWPRLEDYVSGVVHRFRDDERVLVWDVYNEPGNEGLVGNAIPLLDAVFRWVRAVAPSQPLTSGIWDFSPAFAELNRHQLLSSDVVTFHHYLDADHLRWIIRGLRPLGRPLLCTEYMARTAGSTFATHLPVFREEGVGAVSWGLVRGRTQTCFPWDSPRGAPLPATWFHDVFDLDHEPHDPEEVALVREICGGEEQSAG